MIVWLSAQLEMEAQGQIFSHKTFYIKKSFATASSRDVSEELLIFILRVIFTTIRSMVNGP